MAGRKIDNAENFLKLSTNKALAKVVNLYFPNSRARNLSAESNGVRRNSFQHINKMKVPLCLVTTIALIASAAALVAAAADNEASRIFTAENAQQVLGGPVVPAARNSTADIKNGATIVSQCSYSANTGDPAPSVSLTLRRAASADETKSIFLSSKKIYEGKDVTDLGDQAYRTTAPAQLNVLKGKNWLIITAGAFPAADIALQEKAAREILKNLHD